MNTKIREQQRNRKIHQIVTSKLQLTLLCRPVGVISGDSITLSTLPLPVNQSTVCSSYTNKVLHKQSANFHSVVCFESNLVMMVGSVFAASLMPLVWRMFGRLYSALVMYVSNDVVEPVGHHRYDVM